MDLLQLSNAGINNTLAISGTAFTNGHATILKRYTNDIYVTFDGDDPGKKAALKCGYILAKNSIYPNIIIPPNGMDPDDWVKNEGPDPFMAALQQSIEIIEFQFKKNKKNIKSPLDLIHFINLLLADTIQVNIINI